MTNPASYGSNTTPRLGRGSWRCLWADRGWALIVCVALSFCIPSLASAQLTPDDRYNLYPTDVLVSPGKTASVTILIDSIAGSNGSPEQIDGWSLSFCHDPAALQLTAVTHTPLVQALNGSSPLAFSAVTIYPEGFTDGVLIDFLGINTLPQGTGYPLYKVEYEAGPTPGVSTVDFCELGTPPVIAIVATGSVDNIPVREPASVEVLSEPYFKRGDCDNNTGINIADTVFLLQQVFPPNGVTLPVVCTDACDCNDDGTLNLSDAIWSLNAVLGNPSIPLPGPYPQCGPDGASDSLPCAESTNGCP